MNSHRILIVKIAALGDIAVATVLVNRIRAEQPSARITWLTGVAGRELVALFDGVDEIVDVDEQALFHGGVFARLRSLLGVWRRLVGRRFDRILVLHSDARYRVLTLPLVGSPVSSLAHGRNPLLTKFRGAEYARLLDDGIRPQSGPASSDVYAFADIRAALDASVTQNGPRPRIAIVPGGAHNILRDDTLRRWPVASYVALAHELVQLGVEVVLIGDQVDRRVAGEFVSIGDGITDLIGRCSLRETMRVLRDVDVLVSHDTGPLHLARLVRTPVVALFGPTPPIHVVGDADDVDALQAGFDVPCRPCYDGREYARCGDNVCMRGITVAEVLTAVTRRLRLSAPSAP